MNHQEIRFTILHYLYDKHYSDQLGHPQAVDRMIQETELNNVDKNIIYGDIIYLVDSGFVTSMAHPLGYAYPPWIKISNYGIDRIDNIISQIAQEIQADKNNNISDKVKTITTEQNPKTKIEKIWAYVKSNPTFFTNTVEKILRITLGG